METKIVKPRVSYDEFQATQKKRKIGRQANQLYQDALKAIDAGALEKAEAIAKSMWIRSDAKLIRERIKAASDANRTNDIQMNSEIAKKELESVARKAKRMFTRKTFRKPDEKDRLYRAPSKQGSYRGVKMVCAFCGRATAYGSKRCRECYQQQVRAKYEAKVRAEEERVSANERALNSISQEKP